MTLEIVSSNKSFGGWHKRYRHRSNALNCDMVFAVFLPPQAEQGDKLPALYWLSGLTCTDENFMQKAGALRMAAELGLIIVAPDTSPRGPGVPDDADGAWDFGLGAGFYLNATQEPWAEHFRMESYVTGELIPLIDQAFPTTGSRSILGHSMGGHGALTLALRHPDLFRSVSAFAPIGSPTRCPWGEKAFSAYLGDDRAAWAAHDAARLIEGGAARGVYDDILVDQGDADPFLHDQLKPELLQAAADIAGQPLTLRMQPGYDHSYFFMASFIADHIAFHAERLKV